MFYMYVTFIYICVTFKYFSESDNKNITTRKRNREKKESALKWCQILPCKYKSNFFSDHKWMSFCCIFMQNMQEPWGILRTDRCASPRNKSGFEWIGEIMTELQEVAHVKHNMTMLQTFLISGSVDHLREGMDSSSLPPSFPVHLLLQVRALTVSCRLLSCRTRCNCATGIYSTSFCLMVLQMR